MIRILLLLACALPLAAQVKCTVFVITDAEGVAGICRQDQVEPRNQELRHLLTAEVNAAAAGFFSAGADEVIIWDGHDGSQTLSAETIHPRARLLIGGLGASMLLERGFTAVAFLGQHAHANTRGGIMAHSYSSLGIQNIRMNGKPVGEIETRTALAGAYNTPVIFLSGDQAAAAQLRAIVPAAETAVVKEGLSNYTCISLSAEAARLLIKDAAARSLKRLTEIRPYKVDGPVTFEIEYTTRNALPPDIPAGGEMVDARTIRLRGKDFLDAWRLYMRR